MQKKMYVKNTQGLEKECNKVKFYKHNSICWKHLVVMSNTDEAINYPRIKVSSFRLMLKKKIIYIYIPTASEFLLKYENMLNIEKLTTVPKVRQSVTNVCQLVLLTRAINHIWANLYGRQPGKLKPTSPPGCLICGYFCKDSTLFHLLAVNPERA